MLRLNAQDKTNRAFFVFPLCYGFKVRHCRKKKLLRIFLCINFEVLGILDFYIVLSGSVLCVQNTLFVAVDLFVYVDFYYNKCFFTCVSKWFIFLLLWAINLHFSSFYIHQPAVVFISICCCSSCFFTEEYSMFMFDLAHYMKQYLLPWQFISKLIFSHTVLVFCSI